MRWVGKMNLGSKNQHQHKKYQMEVKLILTIFSKTAFFKGIYFTKFT